MGKQIWLLLTLSILLAACGTGATEAVETTPVAVADTATTTATATAVPPTVPIAATRTAVPTATPLPPTETPLPTPTNNPTATPTITATPTETPIPMNPVTHITLERVTNYTFLQPTYLTHAGDERLFVTEQQGVIRIISEGQVLPQPFLYIVDRVRSTAYEQGLLSVAFHPNYAKNGYFYVNYTRGDGSTVVSRFQVSPDNPDLADHGSEQVLLNISQPYNNHNGGQLAFGPDGYLYVGMGDGGSANDPLEAGQSLDTLLGKILRLDVDFNPDGYAVPPDNPFVTEENARNEIWAYGLRNPWRFSFDRLTGDLFIADVGQNLWEEINWEPAGSSGGENYGWNVTEGMHCFLAESCDARRLTPPVFEYSHEEGGCSVTGGYIYRGEQNLALYGNYFLGDFCSGKVFSLFQHDDNTWESHTVYENAGQISTFGEDVNGELYLINHAGEVYQIRP